MKDIRSVVAITLDLHITQVSRELVECKCGWYCKRGEGANNAINSHLEDNLVEALLENNF